MRLIRAIKTVMGARPALLLAAVALLGSGAEAQRPRVVAPDDPASLAEATTPESCEHAPQRVFVQTAEGSECIAFYASAIPAGASRAVFHFHGDFTTEILKASPRGSAMARGFQVRADRAAKKFGVPYFYVVRPGLINSTGDHMKRRQPKEFLSMNAAIDRIKERYGIVSIGLSGQSGGGSVVGALLTLGRTDVVCAAPGSGAYDLSALFRLRATLAGKPATEQQIAAYAARTYSPTANIPGIVKDDKRRIFVVGDPRDKNTFFEQQRDFAYRVKAAGHHVMLLYAPGAGDKRHGVGHIADEVAGYCLQGKTDQEIEQLMGEWWAKEFAKPAAKSAPSQPAQYSNSAAPNNWLKLVRPEAPGAAPVLAQ